MIDYSKYLGIPYQAGGRDFQHCDCWGLVRLFLLNEFEIEIGNYYEYSVDNLDEIKQIIEKVKKEKKEWIQVEEPQPGDILWIQTLKRDFHVGVVVHLGYILHVCNERFSEINKFTHPLILRSVKQKRFWRHCALSPNKRA